MTKEWEMETIRANEATVRYQNAEAHIKVLEATLRDSKRETAEWRAALAVAEEEVRRLREAEPHIRRYLAFSHVDGKCNLYADDGELQCGNLARHGRTIDFRREPIVDLLDIILSTRMREYSATLAHPESPARGNTGALLEQGIAALQERRAAGEQPQGGAGEGT